MAEGLDRDGAGNLLEAVWDKVPVIAAFFVGCLVIGGYWLSNHRFMAMVDKLDRRFMFYVVVYLAFVAFLPFAVGTLGEFATNPVSVAIFALNMGVVSSLEVVLVRRAARAGLFREAMPADVLRWAIVMQISPVFLFVLSIPVAFIAPWLGVLVWFLAAPMQVVLNRWRPAGAERYLD
jgi:uncharacterized membrane protein